MAIDIPVGAPADWGGPFVAAGRNINALTSSSLDNRIKSAQAQYAPYNAYADAVSKIAFAQLGPTNALAQFMASPAAANLTRDQQIALANRMQSLTQNYNMNNVAMPPAPGQMTGGGGGILNFLFSKLLSGQGAPAPSSNIPVTNAVNQPVMTQAPPTATNLPGPPVTNMPAPPPSNALAPTPTTPNLATASRLALPGTQGGLTPQTGAEATKSAVVAGATQEATGQVNAWDEQQKRSSAQAFGAQDTLNTLDKLDAAYNELQSYEKGPGIGKVPGFTPAAKDFDANKVALADAVARAQQQGHITQTDRDTYNQMKVDRDMPKETYKHQSDFIRGMNDRIRERQVFDQVTRNDGYTKPQADIIWSYYINKSPFYDAKNHKLLKDNLGTWEDYLTPEKIKQAFSPKAQKQAALEEQKKVKSFKLPEFNNQIEFQKWYLQQPPETQKLVRQHLGGS